jgi:hypothetical protein
LFQAMVVLTRRSALASIASQAPHDCPITAILPVSSLR